MSEQGGRSRPRHTLFFVLPEAFALEFHQKGKKYEGQSYQNGVVLNCYILPISSIKLLHPSLFISFIKKFNISNKKYNG